MSASEEHLLDVSSSHICVIDFAFNVAGRLIGVVELTIKGWDELDTALVESYRMAEIRDGTARARK